MAYFLRKLKKTPHRLLVARTDRIGDFILSLPVFEAIKKQLHVHLAVLCNESVVPLLKNNPYIDEIIPIRQPFDGLGVKNEVQSRQFDTLLVLVNDPVMLKLLPGLHQIPVRIGSLSKPFALFHYTHPVLQKRSRSLQNEAVYNLELLKIFNLSNQLHLKPRLYLSPDEIQAFRSTHTDFIPKMTESCQWIVLHAGMSGSALNMNKRFYLELLLGLLEKGYLVWLTGMGKTEEFENQSLIEAVSLSQRNRVINATNRFDLRSLAILISQSAVFIGPSTGPTHIANAVGTSLISFYPPIKVQSAKRWGPYLAEGRLFSPNVRCGQKYRCIGEKCRYFYCMDSIQAKEILSQLQLMLNP